MRVFTNAVKNNVTLVMIFKCFGKKAENQQFLLLSTLHRCVIVYCLVILSNCFYHML